MLALSFPLYAFQLDKLSMQAAVILSVIPQDQIEAERHRRASNCLERFLRTLVGLFAQCFRRKVPTGIRLWADGMEQTLQNRRRPVLPHFPLNCTAFFQVTERNLLHKQLLRKQPPYLLVRDQSPSARENVMKLGLIVVVWSGINREREF
jgi:hypothetical protein